MMHTADNSRAAIRDILMTELLLMSYDQLIPQISCLVTILWISLKDKACKRNIHMLHEVEENIQELISISRIFPAELRHVNQSMFPHCNACLKAHMEQFQHLF